MTAVLRVPQGVEPRFEGGGDPLHGMAEEVDQDEASGLKVTCRIDRDPEAVEGPGLGGSRARKSTANP
jgi:hypothetical protein